MKKGILRYIVIAVLIAVIAILLYYHDVVRMIIQNNIQTKIELEEDPWEGGSTYLNVPYSDVSESDYVDIYVPDGVENPKLVVMVHGGGFVYGDSQTRQAKLVYQYFRRNGYAVATVNYRLAQEAQFPAAVQDVKAAVRFLRANADTYGYNADRIAIAGESAGGYLATMVAATNQEEYNDLPFIGEEELEEEVSSEIQVLIDFYGAVEMGSKADDWSTLRVPDIVLDIANYWINGEVLGGYEDVESRFAGKNFSEMTEGEDAIYQPYTYVKENWTEDTDIHVIIIHGNADITVPILQSDRFYELLKEQIGSDRVVYNVVDGAGHAGEKIFSDEEMSKILEFLEEHL